MSYRDTSGRANGDNRPVPLNAAPRTMLAADAARLRTVGVKTVTGTTVDIQVNGVSVLASSSQSVGPARTTPATGIVPPNSFAQFHFGAYLLEPGDVLQATSTDAAAFITANFMAA